MDLVFGVLAGLVLVGVVAVARRLPSPRARLAVGLVLLLGVFLPVCIVVLQAHNHAFAQGFGVTGVLGSVLFATTNLHPASSRPRPPVG